MQELNVHAIVKLHALSRLDNVDHRPSIFRLLQQQFVGIGTVGSSAVGQEQVNVIAVKYVGKAGHVVVVRVGGNDDVQRAVPERHLAAELAAQQGGVVAAV